MPLVVTGHKEVNVVYEVSLWEIGATAALALVTVGPTTAVVEFAKIAELDEAPVAPTAPTTLVVFALLMPVLEVIGAECVCVSRMVLPFVVTGQRLVNVV